MRNFRQDNVKTRISQHTRPPRQVQGLEHFSQEKCKVGGLVHFSAIRHCDGRESLPENMDLSPSASGFAFLLTSILACLTRPWRVATNKRVSAIVANMAAWPSLARVANVARAGFKFTSAFLLLPCRHADNLIPSWISARCVMTSYTFLARSEAVPPRLTGNRESLEAASA